MRTSTSTDEQRSAVPGLTEQNLCAAFQRTVANSGDLPAIRVAGQDGTITWAQYGQRVRAVAEGLYSLGAREGDVVAILLRNQPTFHYIDAALLHLGAVPFSVYHTEPVANIVALLEHSGATFLVTEDYFLDIALAVLDQSPTLLNVIVDGDSEEHSGRVVALDDLMTLTDSTFDFEAAWRAVDADSVACLIYTSGTTGKPKAVQLLHRAVMSGVRGVEGLAPTTPGQTTISFLPAAHITDRFICHYSTMVLGGTITCVPDHEALWDTLSEVHPTRFHGVPRTLEKLADRIVALIQVDPALNQRFERRLSTVAASTEPLNAEDLAAQTPEFADLRREVGLDAIEWLSVAAAPSSIETLNVFYAIGSPLAEVWGMTEFIMAMMNPPSRIKPGTVGIVLSNVEARIGDDSELLLRGDHVSGGYLGAPDLTAALYDEGGWLHTGDLASIDDDGYVRIIGRKKEQMINSSGKNMDPVKIEACFTQRSPLIDHAVAIGDRRRYVTALLVLNLSELRALGAMLGVDGSDAELAAHEAVRKHIDAIVAEGNSRLNRVEQVRAWSPVLDEWLPGGVEVTNTMKLRRGVIHERYQAQIEAMYG